MVLVGRKAKPEEEKAVTHALRWPPRLWTRLVAVAAKLGRKRSKIIHQAVEKEVARLERESRLRATPPARADGEEA